MNTPEQPAGRLRPADLFAALSLETDMAMGHPPEEAMRTCLLASGLARRIGLAETEVADVYWTALIMHIGCTAFAHEQAALMGGDEISQNAVGSKTDFGNPKEMLASLFEMGEGLGTRQKARLFATALFRGRRFSGKLATATCEVAAGMALRLGLSETVQRALLELFERWDGKGAPKKLAGDAIARPARLAQLAAQAMVYDRLAGLESAVAMVRRRSGTALDPHLAEAFVRYASDLHRETHTQDPWRAVIDAEPAPQRFVPESGLDDVAMAFADVVDLKSCLTLGHSRGVAELCAGAGVALGLPGPEVVRLRQAGLLHDLGRVGVPNGIWEKPGPFSTTDWDSVRLHSYHGERILSRSPALAPLAPVVGMHHERLDGSGYYRQAAAAGIPPAARILAAADFYQGLTQARPHRPARSHSAAADRLSSEARQGRLDAEAVDAVLSAAGHPRRRPSRQGWPAGLTTREVEVLRLLVRGYSNAEVGRHLCISRKTVGHHVEHIYGKLDLSSRAGCALFAIRHELLDGFEGEPRKK